MGERRGVRPVRMFYSSGKSAEGCTEASRAGVLCRGGPDAWNRRRAHIELGMRQKAEWTLQDSGGMLFAKMGCPKGAADSVQKMES